jgi:hypothetical protein
MEKEKSLQNNTEQSVMQEKNPNPNSIGELFSMGKDLETSPNNVYRSVIGMEAVDDLDKSGVVRNKQSAGLVKNSRWGERVFWSKGVEGGYHIVPTGTFVIEAPLSVAQERIVTKNDVTAIYSKNEQGEVFDILKERLRIKDEELLDQKNKQKEDDQNRLKEVRESLGL